MRSVELNDGQAMHISNEVVFLLGLVNAQIRNLPMTIAKRTWNG